MKKTYMIPATQVVVLEPQQMIATSVQMVGKNATDPGMSRRRSTMWEDDEEEE
jgi:hypothetical protein